ncbi:RDD family protein [Actinomadura sp. HBU206391]|uniref:RDD family protein n=1 Tax=Actinomadura sp. HBU206391 TaxID=2731692 RepID=UPI0016500527|nr:RDD family protein [Actinomadura sp. HBU206391]MBC6456420.1 RDD family protein [Actinomadura sp. HBU206391]
MSQDSKDDPPGFAPPSEPLPDPGPAAEPQPPPYGRPYGTPGPVPGSSPGAHGAPPPYQPYPQAPPYLHAPPPADPTLAEWWQRLVARIVDTVIIGLVVLPLWIWLYVWYFGLPYPETAAGEPDLEAALRQELAFFGLSLLIGLVQAVITFFYDWLQQGRSGQTVGKRVMKTRVVALPDRAPLTGGTAAKRAGAYAVAGQIPVLGLLDVLWHLWDRPHRQCLHDKFAGTVVVKITPGQGAVPGPWDGR